MDTTFELIDTIKHFCNLNGLLDPYSDPDFIEAIERFVTTNKAATGFNELKNEVENGRIPPCFIPAAEVRRLLLLPDYGGIPAGMPGALYRDAILMLNERGWRRKVKNIQGTLVSGYDKKGHDQKILYVYEEDGVRHCTLCRSKEYHSVKM